ncbi:MAG: serine protease, partial [Rhodospirillaceae bacterium]|nr:serine protease [Rhodospirillaceae bacterium]
QTVRFEWAAVAEIVFKGRLAVLRQNISATTAPPPNARRAVSPPAPIEVAPPQLDVNAGPGASRSYGDLPADGTARRISDIYRESVGAIFTVEAGKSLGSGFAVSQIHVLTNRHVVEDAGSTPIRLVQKGGLVATARIERLFDGDVDLALLRLDKPLPLRPLKLAEELPPIGTEILVIGSPVGLEGSITGGMVSQIRMSGDVGYLQIDASINPGNSGGPVLDRLGRVVGIASSRLIRQNQILGIGFALGSETIRKAISGIVRISSIGESVFITAERRPRNAGKGPALVLGHLAEAGTRQFDNPFIDQHVNGSMTVFFSRSLKRL